ncbi:nup98, partial [Symbiodinium sp. KB8]
MPLVPCPLLVSTPPQQPVTNPISFHACYSTSPMGPSHVARGPSPTRRAWSPPPQMPRTLSPPLRVQESTRLCSPPRLAAQAQAQAAHVQQLSPRPHPRAPQLLPRSAQLPEASLASKASLRPQTQRSPGPQVIQSHSQTQTQRRPIPHPAVHVPPATVLASHGAKPVPIGARPPASWVPASPRVPDPFQRPASPHLVNTQHLPVEYIASPEQMYRMLATQGSAAPPIVLQLSARSSPELTPRKPAAEKLSASPQEEEPAADSLAKQLRALQAAKVDAAAKQVKGDQLIAQRQDQLRKETFSALSADNLGDLLRRWGPPPEQPADWETPRSRHETLAESPVPVVEESPREAVDESQDQMLEELPKEPPAEVEEQEPPSEPAPSLPAHERAKQVSKASTGSARTADGEACKESTQSLNRSSRGRRPSSLSLPAEDARRCAAELAVMARNVSAKEIRELRMLKRPPEAVMKLLEALRVVLGEKDLKPANFRKLLSDSLAQRLAAVDVASIGNARGAKLRSLLSSPDVSAEAVS